MGRGLGTVTRRADTDGDGTGDLTTRGQGDDTGSWRTRVLLNLGARGSQRVDTCGDRAARRLRLGGVLRILTRDSGQVFCFFILLVAQIYVDLLAFAACSVQLIDQGLAGA